MAAVTKPGGLVFVGNVRRPRSQRAESDASAGLYLKPPPAADREIDGVTPEWWRASADLDTYGWDVDPASICVRPLADPTLVGEWGPRYHVFMRRN